MMLSFGLLSEPFVLGATRGLRVVLDRAGEQAFVVAALAKRVGARRSGHELAFERTGVTWLLLMSQRKRRPCYSR